METKKILNNPWYYRLNGELIKKEKPLKPGDQVHLHSGGGCFKVHEVRFEGFIVMKDRNPLLRPWSDFRCFKGDGTSSEAKLKAHIKAMTQILYHAKEILGESSKISYKLMNY